MFYIGDWLNYGERTYGESYAQAMNLTGYDYQTLANAAWVSRGVEVSRRRENLSVGHHHAVASLPPAQQVAMLALAAPGDGHEKPRMTVRELRQAVSASGLQQEIAAAKGVERTEEQLWYARRFQAIEALCWRAVHGSLPPGVAADEICAEAMRIQEKAKED